MFFIFPIQNIIQCKRSSECFNEFLSVNITISTNFNLFIIFSEPVTYLTYVVPEIFITLSWLLYSTDTRRNCKHLSPNLCQCSFFALAFSIQCLFAGKESLCFYRLCLLIELGQTFNEIGERGKWREAKKEILLPQ